MPVRPATSPHIVKPHQKIRLAHISTKDTGRYRNKEEAAADLEKHRQRLDDLQELLTAECSRSVLIVLQGMDASGKDGTIRHIFTGVNPQACNVTSFKIPTPLEREHDFLWRVHNAVPRFGTVGIFNRSHYEDVLVPRVHKLISEKKCRERYQNILQFEKALAENNVVILKFFLHISREEQTQRLEARLSDPKKHWKVSESDFAERSYWPEYTKAYQSAIENTSRKHAPWYIIPSDHKWYRNVAISEILASTLGKLKMKYPESTLNLKKIKL